MAHNPLPETAVGLAVANVKPSGSNCLQYGFPRALRRLRAVLVSSDAPLTDRAISTKLAKATDVQHTAAGTPADDNELIH